MNNQKLLSILIPTYNRADVISYTISLFEEQVKRNIDECELIVCDNASQDSTENVLKKFEKEHPFFKFVEYSEHVEVGDSITRSIENANAKFFIVFGDDDLPAPFMIDTILYELKKYPDIGMLVFNRLAGSSSLYSSGVEGVHVESSSILNSYEEYYPNFKQFANLYNIPAGFISVDVVRLESWRKYYRDVYPNNHEGWNYMVPYLYSVREYPALYLQYPLCTRRTPAKTGNGGHHQWENKWGMIIFVAKGRVLSSLAKYDIIDDWKQIYQNYIGDLQTMFYKLTSMTNAQNLAPYIDELCSYQKDNKRIRMLKRLVLSTNGVTFLLWKQYYKCGFALHNLLKKIR